MAVQRVTRGSWVGVGRTGAAVLAVALILTGAPPGGSAAGADDDVTETPPDEALESAPFRDGEWLGSYQATGPVSRSNPQINMHTLIDGTVGFEVVDDVAAGEWTMQGSASGTIEGGTISNVFQGSGPVEGDDERLHLGGRVGTTWTTTIGGHTEVSEDPIDLGPFGVEVTDVDCNRVLGTWEQSFEDVIADVGGWSSDLDGSFVAVHQGEDPDPALLEEAESLLNTYNDWSDEVRAGTIDVPDEGPFPRPIADRANELVNRAVDLELAMAEADRDDLCLFGQDLGAYEFLLTALVQEVLSWVLEVHPSLTAEDIYSAADILLWMGGVGEGAVRPDVAAELEEQLAAAGSAVLDEVAVTDGRESPSGGSCTTDSPCLPPTDDVLLLLMVGADLGLTLSVLGTDLPPEDAATHLTASDDEVED